MNYEPHILISLLSLWGEFLFYCSSKVVFSTACAVPCVAERGEASGTPNLVQRWYFLPLVLYLASPSGARLQAPLT